MSGDSNKRLPAGRLVDVLIPVAVDKAYTYRLPEGLDVGRGQFVEVPLAARRAVGVAWSIGEGDGANLKTIAGLREWPSLPAPLIEFIDWVARWTLAPRGMVLRMAASAPQIATAPHLRTVLRATGKAPTRQTPARGRALAALADLSLGKSELATAAHCSTGVIDALIEDGAIAAFAAASESVAELPDPDFAPTHLEAGQWEVARKLAEVVERRAFSATLLEGVTGSGKTEVYFEAVAAALRSGRQALILLPEIALTTQFLDRFAKRFGVRPAEWHSGAPTRLRGSLWSAIATGEVRVVAGARSALFLPFRDLGLIIVDEEHEAAYKQEDGVKYHARDMAVVRARIEGASIVLASATPSIETRVNAEQGRYGWLRLSSRFGARRMPALEAVDLRRQSPPRGRWLSPRLVEAIEEGRSKGEQSLLFLNRRGYAPLTLCRVCGRRFQCPNCSAWLVDHRFRRALVCHHCGHEEPRPALCPHCKEADSLAACGPGVERLAEEALTLFPDARPLVLSSDFPGGLGLLRSQLDEAARGAYDLIIGTQLVAKGHNFPLLTLVGVVDADVGLANGDPRAAERTFQLLQQATGRAGRGDKAGRGMIQTWQPEHPVIQALLSGEAERFYAQETRERESAGLPPFGRLASLIVTGADQGAAKAHARALARAAFELPASPRWRVAPLGGERGDGEIMLLGPAEAPVAVRRGLHRFRLLAKAPRAVDLQGFLRALIAAAPAERGGVRVEIDIDPQSFM